MSTGRLLVISGPSGSGKSTIVRKLQEDPRVVFSVSATTRRPRPGEIDGVHYRFLTQEAFSALLDRNAFIEWANVYGNLYGTLREPLERALAEGKVYLLEIDVQGATKLKSLGVEGCYLFIQPPDLDTLRARLVGRGTDDPEQIERRMAKAQWELGEARHYDHVIVNRELESTLREVRELAGLQPAVQRRGGAS